MKVAALDVVQNDEGCALVFLREGGKGLAQFLQGGLGHLAARPFRIEVLDELLKLGVDILRIDSTCASFRDIGINLILPGVFGVSRITWFKELTVTLEQDEIGLLVQFHPYSGIGTSMLELIFLLLPQESLQFGCLQKVCHLAETLGKHVSVFTRVGELLKVHDAVGVEDIADGEESLVDV